MGRDAPSSSAPIFLPDGNVLPLLRWAGSKKRQFRTFESFFPFAFKSYVEPFAGSAAFFFRLTPLNARLNDINPNVSDFYKHARSHSLHFYEKFSEIPRERTKYYQTRARFNALNRSFKKSVLFYYLNRNCFNGIYRLNNAGQFN